MLFRLGATLIMRKRQLCGTRNIVFAGKHQIRRVKSVVRSSVGWSTTKVSVEASAGSTSVASAHPRCGSKEPTMVSPTRGVLAWVGCPQMLQHKWNLRT